MTTPNLSSVMTVDNDNVVVPRLSWQQAKRILEKERAKRKPTWAESLERRPCRICGVMTVFKDVCGGCDDLADAALK